MIVDDRDRVDTQHHATPEHRRSPLLADRNRREESRWESKKPVAVFRGSSPRERGRHVRDNTSIGTHERLTEVDRATWKLFA